MHFGLLPTHQRPCGLHVVGHDRSCLICVTVAQFDDEPLLVIGFLEFHIEQGPFPNARARPLVSSRRPAGAIVSKADGPGQEIADLCATVGSLTVEPNVVNAVPRAVRLVAEFRSPSDETRHKAGIALQRFVNELPFQRQQKDFVCSIPGRCKPQTRRVRIIRRRGVG